MFGKAAILTQIRLIKSSNCIQISCVFVSIDAEFVNSSCCRMIMSANLWCSWTGNASQFKFWNNRCAIRARHDCSSLFSNQYWTKLVLTLVSDQCDRGDALNQRYIQLSILMDMKPSRCVQIKIVNLILIEHFGLGQATDWRSWSSLTVQISRQDK